MIALGWIKRNGGIQQMELLNLPATSRHRQGGFSLLEAMIALVIFSIALLGIAGMYSKMMSMSHSSYLRTLATIQANDFEERLRANPRQKDDYTVTCGATVAATGYAATDLTEWCANTQAVFGGANGLLSSATVVAPSGSDDYVITLTWNERSLDETSGQKDFELVDFEYRVRK